MKLCDNCKRLDIRQLPVTVHPPVRGFQLSTLQQIFDASSWCQLCQLLRSGLLRSKTFNRDVTAAGPVDQHDDLVLVLRRSTNDGFATEQGARLSGFEVSLGQTEFIFSVLLYAPRGMRDDLCQSFCSQSHRQSRCGLRRCRRERYLRTSRSKLADASRSCSEMVGQLYF